VRDDETFLAAIRAAPTAAAPRLAYADWLEERADPRAAYLRAEVDHFSAEWDDIRDSPAWSLRKQVDPVWAAIVSRAPLGILVPGLTFLGCGPKLQPADLRRIEDRWQARLPPDYAAFLLCFNGGRPSRPYLYSYADYSEGAEEYYDEVRFFSTEDRDLDGRPYLLLSVVEVYHGRVSERTDAERLSRLMPIGTVGRDDGSEAMLALDVQGDEFPQVTEVVYWEHSGVSEEGDVHATDSFTGVLLELRER
jgi:uncharacterized protein (TIGR02996 family)